MSQLSCFLHRSRLERYADGALGPRMIRSVEGHLGHCADCRGTVDRQVELRSLVKSAAADPEDPDWTGFWSGVQLRLVRDDPRPMRDPWWIPLWKPFWGHPRLALGGAMAAVVAVALSLWPGQEGSVTVNTAWADPVEVQDVATADPDRSVMVYSEPGQVLTVIWLFPDTTDES